MGIFRKANKKLEGLVEGGFGRAFKSSVQPVELAHKLAKEMGDHKTVGVSNVYVPNEFDVYLGKDDYEHLVSFEDSLKTELSNYVTAFARREGWTLVAPPRIELHCDDDLRVGEFGIATRTVSAPAEAPGRRRVRAPPAAVAPPAAAVARRPGASTRPCCTRSRAPAAPAAAPPARASSARGVLRGRQGDYQLTRGGHRHRPQPALRHRPHRPQRLAAARRDPPPGRRLHAARPRLHQRHARQPARRQAGRAAARRPHRARHHRAPVREAALTGRPRVTTAPARRSGARRGRVAMIDIVLLVLKIGILVLLYLFIWQVVKTAVQNVRGGGGARGRRARRRRCRPATGSRPCSRRPSATQRREDRLVERTMDGEKMDFSAHINPRLVVEESPIVPPGVIFPLEGWINVGRAATSDIVLDEQFVSSTHARLVPRGQFYYVEDLGSTNGTFVNEKQVTEAQLKLDSRLRIGETTFRYEE